jgi:hypothetical protein
VKIASAAVKGKFDSPTLGSGGGDRSAYSLASPWIWIEQCDGQVAQLVEQRTENPCVGGSTPPLTTFLFSPTAYGDFPGFCFLSVSGRVALSQGRTFQSGLGGPRSVRCLS